MLTMKRVAWFSVSMQACGSVPVVMIHFVASWHILRSKMENLEG